MIDRSGLRRRPPLRQLVFNTASVMFGRMLATTPTSAVPLVFPDETLRQHAALLAEMARKYIWWMPAEEALDYPARIVAQVMNIGVFRDACRVADALGDDCERAALVVTARQAPPSCLAPVIDQDRLRRQGAMALRRTRDGFAVDAVRPKGIDRPWSPAIGGDAEAETSLTRRAPAGSSVDATPSEADLQSGD